MQNLECLDEYRQELRQILVDAGVSSCTSETIPDSILEMFEKKFGWSKGVAREKIAKTQNILELRTAEDALMYLLYGAAAGFQSTLVICDGCSVNEPFEHRCHTDDAWCRGESTGKPCRCVDCFIVRYLLL